VFRWDAPAPPGVRNAIRDSFSAAGTLTYKPLEEGPTWQEQLVFKSLQNANNESVVEFENTRYKCLGAQR
jgi:hypothetical protein